MRRLHPSREVFDETRAKKWGDLLDIDDQEDTCYHSKRLCIFTKMRSNVFETFKVIFQRKEFWIRAKEVPGWVPEFMEESDDESIFKEEMPDMEGGMPENNVFGESNDPDAIAEIVFTESVGLNGMQSADPFNIYDLLNKEKQQENTKVSDDSISQNNVSGESSNPDAIAETVFTESVGLNGMQSADPFNIYDLLNKGKQQENTKVSDDSISREHPPGFTPKEDDKELDHVDDNISEPKEDLHEDKDINSTYRSYVLNIELIFWRYKKLKWRT
nr:glucose-methanol-choline oxidoreductase, FAD/NAD(P)-binding domain protein [Tanacetum cinerariifolium]